MRTVFVRAALFVPVFLIAAASGASAQAAPSPVPSPSPAALQYSGNVRFYFFTRTNEVQNAGNPNRFAFNFGGKLHVEYRFANSPLSLGATYFGADPFGLNGPDPGFYKVPLDEGAPVSAGNPLVSKIDNTLPGFRLSSLGEAYLRYEAGGARVTVGNQVLNLPWAPSSDSRIVPSSYQAADAQIRVTKNLSLNVDRVVRFQPRTNSNFAQTTLLTGGAIAGQPNEPYRTTSGMLSAGLSYKRGSQLAVSATDYQFYDIANLIYAEGKYFPVPHSPLKPFAAAQFVSERNTGASFAGIVNDQTIGMQIGASLGKNIDVTLGFDQAPWHIDTRIGTCPTVTPTYFAPGNGQAFCKSYAPGTAAVYYGGIASPYSDQYATDPLFTTSISQGMADRHAPGQSFKMAATFQSNDKRFKLIASEGYYDYGNGIGPFKVTELNLDGTYFFNKVGAGAYRGLSLRHRYAERMQPTAPLDFKYNRTQLEYDF